MVYSDKQVLTAQRMISLWEDNISFIEERIRVQKSPGFNRFNTVSGASCRIYSQVEIDIMQNKIDTVLANLEETANFNSQADKSVAQDKYERGLTQY